MINSTNRPLGANEKVYWILDQKISTHFAVAVELDGNATTDAWRNAIDIAQKKHPSLFLKIKGQDYTDLTFEQVEECKIPLRVTFDTVEEDWNAEIEKELQIPFNLQQAPLARALLIQQPRKSIFIFLSNHSIGEGMSVALIIKDILSALAGEKLNPLMVSPSLDELSGIALRTNQKDNSNEPQHPSSKWAAKRKPLEAVKIKRLALTRSLTDKIIKRAKSENTSVHAVLSAAFILAKSNMQGWKEKPVRILHPISARKALNIGDDYGLMLNIVVIPYNHQAGTDFWEVAKIAKSSLMPMQNKEWIKEDICKTTGLFDSGLDLKTITDILVEGTSHDIMLTNLGLIPFETDFGKLKVTALWGPMVITPHNLAQTVGIATINGSLTFALTGYHASDGILEAVEQVLMAACLLNEPVTAD